MDAVGIGAVLAAVGICCATTLAATAFGAGIIATVVGVVAGLDWLAPPLAIIGLIGAVTYGSRRHRARTATRGQNATGHVR